MATHGPLKDDDDGAAAMLPRRVRFGSVRTPYVTKVEQQLRRSSASQGVRDPDFALARDRDFWEKVDGNATIRGARDYRRHLVAGPRTVLEAPTAFDKPLVPYADALLRRLRRFATTRLGFADAPFRGLVVGRMFGGFDDLDLLGDGTTRRWFVLDRVKVQPKGRWELKRWQEDGRTFWAWAVWDYETSEWVRPPNPDWYVFHRYDEQEDHFYGRDMGRVLYWLAHAEHVLWESGLDTAERFGAPWIKGQLNPEVGGVAPGSGGDLDSFAAAANKVKDVLAKLRAHNIVVGDSRLLDVTLLEAGLRGADLIDRLLQQIQHAIRILILGSNLPTSATSGGSFSLAQVQDESTRRLVRYDRELLGETLSEQVVARLVRWNRPALASIPHPDAPGRTLADCAAPLLRVADDDGADAQEKSFSLQVLQATGVPVRRQDVYALAGLTPPGPEDETVTLGGAGGAPGLFAERGAHSPVWRDYADGRLA